MKRFAIIFNVTLLVLFLFVAISGKIIVECVLGYLTVTSFLWTVISIIYLLYVLFADISPKQKYIDVRIYAFSMVMCIVICIASLPLVNNYSLYQPLGVTLIWIAGRWRYSIYLYKKVEQEHQTDPLKREDMIQKSCELSIEQPKEFIKSAIICTDNSGVLEWTYTPNNGCRFCLELLPLMRNNSLVCNTFISCRLWLADKDVFYSIPILKEGIISFSDKRIGNSIVISPGESIMSLNYSDEAISEYKAEIVRLQNEEKERVLKQQLEAEQREKEKIRQKLLAQKRRIELERIVTQEMHEAGELNMEGTKRRHIPRSVVSEVYHRDGAKCVFCGSTQNLQLDHIIPFSKGGADTAENLQLLCQKCNLEKSNKI